MPLAMHDRAIVRDAIVRARLGLTLPEERAYERPPSPTLLGERTEPTADGSARSSVSVKPHCVYCGHTARLGWPACGAHLDLLDLDQGGSDA